MSSTPGHLQQNDSVTISEEDALARELSARTILFHDAVARTLGISTTEHKCLDLIERAGESITAGQLAELSGLTTGAITGILDRLERLGYVQRDRSSEDRRKVFVSITPLVQEKYYPLMMGLGMGAQAIIASYPPKERAVIADFVRRSIDLLKGETALLEARKTNPRDG